MNRTYLAALALVTAAVVAISVMPEAPPLDDTRRTESLVVCVPVADAPAFWDSWGAWFCGADQPCLSANAIVQGVPMCLGGAPAGWVLRMPATPLMADRARKEVDGAVWAEPEALGWSACPDVSTP
jgi:hypothetical protein